ncbi:MULTISPECIES: DUF1778 domain-containing protein [unclassified Mesorhizobium]|uniref:type II toxin-antitoxin system TacA family antitoxin n=1 Tax=unclassified Mesorhizobium TaxID=325217 RepID=UPI0011282DC8|nr:MULTISPECIES: DUF1778 domain-containing protein [unclassified Mesorhizobium]MBZ9916529.1 DUF1778 domain-containing protein [Mesorhizobium sp. BR1-1-7]MBZ9951440.1 DUF1778 domain-containing protein [Mesorhizobium sp. BR1-1-15]MBZ9968810.1 DUF1778 domain-containing protein [Mesorhizobium sp. BR1-1-12]MBZ9981810.1 DUF1778 domain-containing protein [Mesorhizobium sp. BR-1-1-8]TPL39775.1 DUF1778 domain-containing protein [Mesorhizobium sp. B2-4-8]
MTNQLTRTSRLEARISPDMLGVVKRAAEIQGRSVSDFVVSAAQEAAQRTIEEIAIIRLSIEDQLALVEAILNPPEPNEALRKAADAYKRVVVESR